MYHVIVYFPFFFYLYKEGGQWQCSKMSEQQLLPGQHATRGYLGLGMQEGELVVSATKAEALQ